MRRSSFFSVLVFLALGALSVCAPPDGCALTLGQLKTEVRRNIRDTSANADEQRYSDGVLVDFINAAQRDVVNASWLSQKATSYVLSANTTFYDLPADMIAPLEVNLRLSGGQVYELQQIPLRALYDKMPNWDRVSAVPTMYVVLHASFSQVGSSSTMRVAYVPIPNNTSTGAVTMWYFNQVDDLVQDSDVPFNGKFQLVPYHMCLVYNVVARIKMIEGRLEEANGFASLANGALQALMSKVGSMPDYNPSVGVMNRSNSR